MTFFSTLWHNLGLFLRLQTFRRADPAGIVASPGQVKFAVALFIALQMASAAIAVWPVGGIHPTGMATLAGLWFGIMACVVLGAAIGGRSAMAPRALVIFFYAFSMSYLLMFSLSTVTLLAGQGGWDSTVLTILIFAAVAWPVLMSMRIFDESAWKSVLRAAPTLVLLLALGWTFSRYVPWGARPLFSANAEYAESEEEEASPVDVEQLYYAQPALMERAVSSLRPGRPGETDVYAILVGGTSYQSVFLTEVEAVSDILARTYGTEGRTIVLANSTVAPERHPMANRKNLARSIEAVAQRMAPTRTSQCSS